MSKTTADAQNEDKTHTGASTLQRQPGTHPQHQDRENDWGVSCSRDPHLGCKLPIAGPGSAQFNLSKTSQLGT